MRKLIIFAVSFILLFTLFQVVSGMILTMMYTPDVAGAWQMSASLSEGAILSSDHHFMPTLFCALLAAVIAYLIPTKMLKQK